MLHQDLSGLTPGAHLRAEIEHLGLDQVAIAEATGVSQQTIKILSMAAKRSRAPWQRNSVA
jgi:plasmid maintenance system antidote protein VapI